MIESLVPAEVRVIVRRYEEARARHFAAKGAAFPPAAAEATRCERQLAEAIGVIGRAIVVAGIRYHVIGLTLYRARIYQTTAHKPACRPQAEGTGAGKGKKQRKGVAADRD